MAKSSARMFPNSIDQNDDFADESWVRARHLKLALQIKKQSDWVCFYDKQ